MMDENLPELPHGWVWIGLGDISEMIQYGTSERATGDSSGIPVLRMGNIQDGKLDFGNLKYLQKDLPQIDKFILQYGDVLFNRTNSAELVGKTAVYKSHHPRALFASYLIRVRVIHGMYIPDLLSFFINSFYGRKYIISVISQQVGQANVNGRKLSLMPIPLFPLPEQKRIVAKIEELFTELDAGIDALKKVKTKLKRYRQAVLKYAFEGNLTEEWREIHRDELEPASVLLDRIKEGRKKKWEEAEFSKMKRNDRVPKDARWKNAYKDPLKSNNRVDIKLPRMWNWTNLDTLTYSTIDYRGKTPPTAERGIPIISAANVKNGKIVVNKPRFVSQETYSRWTTRGLPEPGDLIVTTEAPVGEAALYPCEETYLLTRRVLACQTLGVKNQYLSYFFYSELAKKYLNEQSRGTTVPRILKPILLSMPIPLPPFLEQQRIVEEIERRFSVADEIEKTVENTLKQAERLRQSILKRAFEGKLVPQNPEDEPASVLLERIKAEKSKKESENQRKSKKKSEKYEQKRLMNYDE